MKRLLLLLLCFCLAAPAYSQITFNRQYNFDFPFKVLTSVLPTDSCYYATGIVTDTAGGTYKIGNIFVKFNLEGEAEYLKLLAAPGKYYETWSGDLTRTSDGGFVDIGVVKDSTVKGLLLKYNSVGDTLFTKGSRNNKLPRIEEVILCAGKAPNVGIAELRRGLATPPARKRTTLNGEVIMARSLRSFSTPITRTRLFFSPQP